MVKIYIHLSVALVALFSLTFVYGDGNNNVPRGIVTTAEIQELQHQWNRSVKYYLSLKNNIKKCESEVKACKQQIVDLGTSISKKRIEQLQQAFAKTSREDKEMLVCLAAETLVALGHEAALLGYGFEMSETKIALKQKTSPEDFIDAFYYRPSTRAIHVKPPRDIQGLSTECNEWVIPGAGEGGMLIKEISHALSIQDARKDTRVKAYLEHKALAACFAHHTSFIEKVRGVDSQKCVNAMIEGKTSMAQADENQPIYYTYSCSESL
jgi:hypothetical protein